MDKTESILELLSNEANWSVEKTGDGYSWVFRQNTSGISLDPANVPRPWEFINNRLSPSGKGSDL